MLPPARVFRWKSGTPMRRRSLNEQSNSSPLSSTRIIIMRELASKAEISRSRFAFSSKGNASDRRTTNLSIWWLALTKLGRHDEARRAQERALERVRKYLDLNPDE